MSINHQQAEFDAQSCSSIATWTESDSTVVTLDAMPSSARHSRRQACKDPEAAWAELCLKMDAEEEARVDEEEARLEKLRKGICWANPIYENGKYIATMYRYSNTHDVRIEYSDDCKPKKPVFKVRPYEAEVTVNEHDKVMKWVEECALRDAALKKAAAPAYADASPATPRTVKFNNQTYIIPSIAGDNFSDIVKDASGAELQELGAVQRASVDASFGKCDETTQKLTAQMKGVNSQIAKLDANTKELQCQILFPEMYEAAKELSGTKEKLHTADEKLKKLAEDLKKVETCAIESAKVEAATKKEKAQLQQTFDDLTAHLSNGFPTRSEREENRKLKDMIADLKEQLRFKTVQFETQELMTMVLKREIAEHEAASEKRLAIEKDHETIQATTRERDDALATASKAQEELQKTKAALQIANGIAAEMQEHANDAAELAQAMAEEGATTIEELHETIQDKAEQLDQCIRERDDYELQLKVERRDNVGAKEFMNKMMAGYLGMMSKEKDGKWIDDVLSKKDSEENTASSPSPSRQKVVAWLGKVTTRDDSEKVSPPLSALKHSSDGQNASSPSGSAEKKSVRFVLESESINAQPLE